MSAILDASRSNPREGGPTFSFRHRVYRLAWNVIWSVFGIWTPVPLHTWRRFLANAFGARIDKTAKIYPGVRIWYPPNLTLGAYATLAQRVICYSMGPIRLDDYALVSQGAHLCGGTHDVDDPNFQLITKPIHLGREAWIAAEAFVGPGVVVGERAVLGARGVTVRNLDAGWIYAGNPAKKIRQRKQ